MYSASEKRMKLSSTHRTPTTTSRNFSSSIGAERIMLTTRVEDTCRHVCAALTLVQEQQQRAQQTEQHPVQEAGHQLGVGGLVVGPQQVAHHKHRGGQHQAPHLPILWLLCIWIECILTVTRLNTQRSGLAKVSWLWLRPPNLSRNMAGSITAWVDIV